MSETVASAADTVAGKIQAGDASRPHHQPPSRTPRAWLTVVLVASYLLLFVAMSLGQGRNAAEPGTWMAPFTPWTVVQWGGIKSDLVRDGQWWRLLTALFLHADLGHLACNALGLLAIGAAVEGSFGARGLIFLYVVTGLVANGCSVSLASADRPMLQIGGSGAIFGLYGFLVVLHVLLGMPRRWETLRMFAVSIGIGFLLTQWYPIDNTAHLAGAGCGIALGAFWFYFRIPPMPWLSAAAGVLCFCLLGTAAALQVRQARADDHAHRQELQTFVRKLTNTLADYARLPANVRYTDDYQKKTVAELTYAKGFLVGTRWADLASRLMAILSAHQDEEMTDPQRSDILETVREYADLLRE